MAVFDFGDGPDLLELRFTTDPGAGEQRINFGDLPDNAWNGNDAEWQPVTSVDAFSPDVFRVHDDFPAQDAFFFSNLLGGPIHLLGASINGVDIDGAHFDAIAAGDYGPVFFDGNTEASDPDPDPEPEPVDPPRTLTGTSSSDTLVGGTGNDTISGLGADDILRGLAGDDVLRGGAGSDLLDGGPGSDSIVSNSGVDRVIFRHGYGNDTVTDFTAGTDLVLVDDADAAVRTATRGAVSGTEVFFEGGDASVLWLPGATDLHLLTALS